MLIRAHIKKSFNNDCWWGCGEKGPSFTVGGNGSASIESNMYIYPKIGI